MPILNANFHEAPAEPGAEPAGARGARVQAASERMHDSIIMIIMIIILYIYTCIYIYIYITMYSDTCVYIYIYMLRYVDML